MVRRVGGQRRVAGGRCEGHHPWGRRDTRWGSRHGLRGHTVRKTDKMIIYGTGLSLDEGTVTDGNKTLKNSSADHRVTTKLWF